MQKQLNCTRNSLSYSLIPGIPTDFPSASTFSKQQLAPSLWYSKEVFQKHSRLYFTFSLVSHKIQYQKTLCLLYQNPQHLIFNSKVVEFFWFACFFFNVNTTEISFWIATCIHKEKMKTLGQDIKRYLSFLPLKTALLQTTELIWLGELSDM